MQGDGDRFWLHDYHPYRKGQNPRFRKSVDGRILDLKEGNDRGVEWATKQLGPELGQMVPPDPEVLIAVMPSHDPAQSPDQGIRAVARNLVGYGYGDAVDFLVRTTRIPKKADGGVRDLEVEVNSLRLDHARRVRGAAIVLLDDVTTKGTSFSAGRHLLTAAGAEQVICVAIGKTFREVG